MVTKDQYKYDVFISYSHKDEKWVHNILVPTLEKNGLNVIIDFRDFEPGAPSITEMERAAKDSWKTILVLTPNYISSAWSEFESIMTATLDPGARQRRIIPIFLERCDIPLRINYLTYLDFTDPDKATEQWKRLLTIFEKDLQASPPIETRSQLEEAKIIPVVSSANFNQLRQFLLESDELSSSVRLRALFADPRLLPFRSDLPDADSVAERADILLNFLVGRRLVSGESLLEVFLEILESRINSTDARILKLRELRISMKM